MKERGTLTTPVYIVGAGPGDPDLLTVKAQRILKQAIELGGTTLQDFVGGDGQPGYFAQRLWVYGRVGQPCRRCQSTLKGRVIGQRASCYCPQCQS